MAWSSLLINSSFDDLIPGGGDTSYRMGILIQGPGKLRQANVMPRNSLTIGNRLQHCRSQWRAFCSAVRSLKIKNLPQELGNKSRLPIFCAAVQSYNSPLCNRTTAHFLLDSPVLSKIIHVGSSLPRTWTSPPNLFQRETVNSIRFKIDSGRHDIRGTNLYWTEYGVS